MKARERMDKYATKLQSWWDGGMRTLTAFKRAAFSEPVMATPKRIILR